MSGLLESSGQEEGDWRREEIRGKSRGERTFLPGPVFFIVVASFYVDDEVARGLL